METQTLLGRARTLERALIDLRGIRKARVDLTSDGEVSVEVLAVPERSERALKEMVGETVRSIFGTNSTIRGVKILIAAKRALPGAEQPRRKLSSLVTRRTHENFSTQVILSRGGDVATGEAECVLEQQQARSVAQAVVDGLHDVSEQPLQLQNVETVRLGEETLALVSLTFGTRSLLGTAEVRFDLPDAIARATLQALNRSITCGG